MASRVGFRAAQQSFHQFRANFQNSFRFSQRRANATAADAAVDAGAAAAQKGFGAFWNSPIGPKTVHFWAPIMKWGMVLAGASDFTRPAESLSLSQNAALMTTGLIWTRWCFVIRPKNLFLASVNFLVFLVGGTQVARVLSYQASLKGDSVADEAKKDVKEGGKTLEKVIENPKSIKDAVVGSK